MIVLERSGEERRGEERRGKKGRGKERRERQVLRTFVKVCLKI